MPEEGSTRTDLKIPTEHVPVGNCRHSAHDGLPNHTDTNSAIFKAISFETTWSEK
jgi:hypothetical protein